MEWGTLAVAAIGALFGIGATVITDAMRSRRERDQRWSEAKQLVYVRFLTALAQAHSRMVIVVSRGDAGETRRHAVHDAFHNDPQHAGAKSVLRELALVAPDHVHQVALPLYEQLRIIRNALGSENIAVETPEYWNVVRPFFQKMEALQRVMRDDLQPPSGRRQRLASSASPTPPPLT
ncbi:hypothetical protein [Streptomyces genisteinicus]|uniref:Uncharacterized protein n=1 Tax=Streptomyces genisteinicus TaxID=2768068 RepID=A0A7H0HZG3_9ACTN|nr:hypothetical protein [Streptomyces genisteinicus]QNP65929.1 hypothetical protein IAG43_25375 [Streptomyces genisteinicus]